MALNPQKKIDKCRGHHEAGEPAIVKVEQVDLLTRQRTVFQLEKSAGARAEQKPLA